MTEFSVLVSPGCVFLTIPKSKKRIVFQDNLAYLEEKQREIAKAEMRQSVEDLDLTWFEHFAKFLPEMTKGNFVQYITDSFDC